MQEKRKIKFVNSPIKKNNKINKKLQKKSFFDIMNNNRGEIIQTNNIDSKKKITSNDKNKNEIIEKSEETLVYNDDELNDLPYEEAKKYDHRTYCLYYISLLKTNHEIIFTFFYSLDYNSKIIKIDFQ